jgi:hypothetical protein
MATSNWEEVEVSLSQVYAIMAGLPLSSKEAYQRYGDRDNFKDRLASLQRIAKHDYFVRRNSQDLEGEFDNIVQESRRYSIRRNEIVHSVVRLFAVEHITLETGELSTRPSFYLVPPEFKGEKFDENDKPTFIYTSVEIRKYGSSLLLLKSENMDRHSKT